MAAEHSTAKTCTLCGETKPIESFVKELGRYRNQCRTCRAAQKRASRSRETPERRAERLRYYNDYISRDENRWLDYKREYYAANVERLSEIQKARYLNDRAFREDAKRRAAEWRVANKDRKLAANKEWAIANPDKARRSALASKAKRRQNPTHRLYAAIGTQMRNALRGKNGARWTELAGYSIGELKAHLERQFINGMTWENYGKMWHVDHIVPQVLFELKHEDIETIRACWSLSNLRPLNAKENSAKRDKRDFLI